MTVPEDPFSGEDRQIAALREEIRRSGSQVSDGRSRWLAWCAAAAVLGGLMAVLAVIGYGTHPYGEQRAVSLGLFLFGTGLGIPGALAGGTLGAAQYWRRRERLRCRTSEKLRELPRERRAEVLQPLLYGTSGDTRQVAWVLLQELGNASEVTPSAAPAARGDELAPDERPEQAGADP